MEQTMEHLVAAIQDNQEKKDAKIGTNNEKFEVLPGTLISWMDIYQARTVSTQEEMKAMMDIYQGKMEATIHFIWTELEETDNTSYVDQKTDGLHN
jgi:UDP-3-O-acyl-N-acetylglucosamine deacetylase